MFRKLTLRTALVYFILVILLSYNSFPQKARTFLNFYTSIEGIVSVNYGLQCSLDTTQVVSGQPFSIKVTYVDLLTQQSTNPISPVEVTVTAGAGCLGTLSGTTIGTIPTNDNNVTISGIVYTNTSGEAKVQLISSASDLSECMLITNFLAPEPSVQDANIMYGPFFTYYSKDGSTSLMRIDLSWTNGDGSKRLVVMKEADPISIVDFPIDGFGYTANSNYGFPGTEIGSAYIIFNGEWNQITVTNLIESFIYYVRIFAYNGDAELANYNINTSNGNPEVILDVDDTYTTSGFNITNISPNPAFNDIKFTINVNTASLFTIEVVDLLGCVVAKYCNKKFYDIGDYPITIPLANLPSGSYVLKIYNKTDLAFRAFTIMR